MATHARARWTALFALGLLACAFLACGGPPLKGVRLRPTPSDVTTLLLIQQNNQSWTDWKQGEGLYVDRDFLNCYQLNGLPTPAVQPVDDPSGHSRARRDCGISEQEVIAAIPAYQRLAAPVTGVTVSDTSDQKAQFDAVVKARTARLTWAMNVEAAAAKGDSAALNTLRFQIAQIATLESSAVGIDLSKAPTPKARATLPYIPGVPTATATPKKR